MFYSQCLLSRKGPLGAIWVAAYSFKKLKKSQVNQTDISSSVDKILQDEWDAVAYRVLAYLLLGVVRIYSKKVEYLYDDCNEVLVKINKFVVSTKKNAGPDKLRAPYYAVTLPDRFELDAFDLGILEFEDVSGGNVVSHEDITLKDSAYGRGQFYSGMYDYEEFDACDTPVKDVLSSHWLDFDMELLASSSGAKSAPVMEEFHENRFSQEECVDLERFCRVEHELPRQVKSSGEGQETNGEQLKAPDIALLGDAIRGEANPAEKLEEHRLSHEGLNLETFDGTEREPSHHVRTSDEDHQIVRTSNEDHQIDREEVMEPELVQPESQTCPIVVPDHNLITVEAGMEKLQSCTVSQEDYMDIDTFNGVKQPRELACPSGEANHNDGEPKKLLEMNSPDRKERQIIMQEDPDPLSVSCDGTPGVKIPNAGVTAPKFMVIHTPASKEFARFSKKRKCVMDDMTVLPNEIIRKSINDASDLVSKRNKVPQTALAVWKASRIANLCCDFSEPLIPAAVSRDLISLFCKKKLKIMVPAKPVAPPEKLDAPESPSVVRSEQIEIAPETPILRSQAMKSFGSPKSPDAADMDIVTPETYGRVEKEEPPPDSEQAAPSGYAEEVPFLDRDQEHDFNLLNEDIDSYEGVYPQLEGLSTRTRIVARYLHRHFPNCKNQGEEEVNLLEVSEGRTKKESARLFYELLVLKTQGYVNVKQDDAYGDILISKRPKWDQTWGDDDVDNRGTSETMYLCA